MFLHEPAAWQRLFSSAPNKLPLADRELDRLASGVYRMLERRSAQQRINDELQKQSDLVPCV